MAGSSGVKKPVEWIQAMCDGVTLTDLASIFHTDRRYATEKIRNLKPSMIRDGHPVYRIDEAARYLMDPLVDVEAYIKQLRPNDLPPLLLKEFWAGQLNKQKFDLNDANLWPTADVMAVLADVFKKLKTGILLFADTIEAKSDLTDKQRKLINELSDGLLVELHRTLVEGDIDDEVKPKRKAQVVLDVEDDGL
jgi:hypothetical protein